MRVHIQNMTDDPGEITRAQWDAAIARVQKLGTDIEVSIASSAEAFVKYMGSAEILVSSTRDLEKRFPVDAPSLRIIYTTSAGVERLAPFDWLPPGVRLLNNRGTHGPRAGEYVLMALLMLASHVPAFHWQQRQEIWQSRNSSVLHGRTVMIIGLGSLGGAAAMQAARMGMIVVGVRARPASDPNCNEVIAAGEIDSRLPNAEFLVLACPLTDATHRILDRRRIALLPKGAGVVNIGRGGLIEQDALCDALDSGHLGGAVLDVTVPEPVPPGHRLWRTKNLLVTPHMSSDDPRTYNQMTLDILMANLVALREELPLPTEIDLARGY